ncbi:hypothetical protein ASH00_08865 [Arthrobacter sp. Soil782]|uniref:hypothetical protein n=1 Tax=Arthrobacter sp. Soil782 TaxID=1736410 RepID=UPI0006F34FB1|nr:hypothetical protein [Arthrobacter sp. Soil782]KRF06341.1 hypothetical protein ASH00_08865 [Arthrobacter sp. Soil782]
MIEQIHAAEHGDWRIRTASGTIYRFEATAVGSFLTRYAQITATTPEYRHLPVYDLRKDGESVPVLAFSGVQLNEEILFTLDIRGDGIETVRRTTPAVSIDAWDGEPTPEELTHRPPRLPWVPAEIRIIEL